MSNVVALIEPHSQYLPTIPPPQHIESIASVLRKVPRRAWQRALLFIAASAGLLAMGTALWPLVVCVLAERTLSMRLIPQQHRVTTSLRWIVSFVPWAWGRNVLTMSLIPAAAMLTNRHLCLLVALACQVHGAWFAIRPSTSYARQCGRRLLTTLSLVTGAVLTGGLLLAVYCGWNGHYVWTLIPVAMTVWYFLCLGPSACSQLSTTVAAAGALLGWAVLDLLVFSIVPFFGHFFGPPLVWQCIGILLFFAGLHSLYEPLKRARREAKEEAERLREEAERLRREREAEERARLAAREAKAREEKRQREWEEEQRRRQAAEAERQRRETEWNRSRVLADLDQLERVLSTEQAALTSLVERLDPLPMRTFFRQKQLAKLWLGTARRIAGSIETARKTAVSAATIPADVSEVTGELHEALNQHQGGALTVVGALADRQHISIQSCGGSRSDAILVLLDILNRNSNESPLMAALFKSITPEGRVCLHLHRLADKWQSIFFEIDFETSPLPDELVMSVSAYIPFGIDDDPNHYPPEQSAAYTRPNQSLQLTVRLLATNVLRTSVVNDYTDESSCVEGTTSDHSHRSGLQRHDGSTERSSTRSSTAIYSNSGPPGYGPRTETVSSWENGVDRQSGSGSSSSMDVIDSRRYSTERATRDRTSHAKEDTTEYRRELTFTSVGINYSKPKELLEAWRSHPDNREASNVFDYLLRTFSTLGDAIRKGIAQRKMAARGKPAGGHTSGALDRAFWDEASRLILVERAEDAWLRVTMPLDGRILPFDESAVDHRRLIGTKPQWNISGSSHPESATLRTLPPAKRGGW